MKMQFIQTCVVVLAMIAATATAQAPVTSSNGVAVDAQTTAATNAALANAQLAMAASVQGNAVVQPFSEPRSSGGFINDINSISANEASAQLMVADFQNAGMSAEDAQKIVAGLSVGGNREATQPAAAATTTTTTTTATTTNNSNAGAPVAVAATATVSATPVIPAVASPAATFAAPVVTLAPAAVPATTAPGSSAPPRLTMSPAASAATAAPVPASSAPAATAAAVTTNAATALSASVESPSDSSSSESTKGAGAATWLAGGVGCLLAVAAVAAVYRRKMMRPKTPGTPSEQKATYFHCEARLTPPVYLV